MLDWIKRRMQMARMAALMLQLENNLTALPPDRHASVLIQAMEFCASLPEDGRGFALGLEAPSPLIGAEDLYHIYWAAEEVLLVGERQNRQTVQRASSHLGPEAARGLGEQMRLTEAGLRLLLANVAVNIFPELRPRMAPVKAILGAVPTKAITKAAEDLEAMQSLSGGRVCDAEDMTERAFAYAMRFLA